MVPELDFRIDRSTDEAEHIARALENVPATMAVEKDEEGYPIQVDAPGDADGDPSEEGGAPGAVPGGEASA